MMDLKTACPRKWEFRSLDTSWRWRQTGKSQTTMVQWMYQQRLREERARQIRRPVTVTLALLLP